MNRGDMAFYGVYRGVVLDNTDPQVSGRVKVDVEGREAWALVMVHKPQDSSWRDGDRGFRAGGPEHASRYGAGDVNEAGWKKSTN